jgi:hypothetical protein
MQQFVMRRKMNTCDVWTLVFDKQFYLLLLRIELKSGQVLIHLQVLLQPASAR